MENDEHKPTGIARRVMAYIKGDAEIPGDTGELGEQWESGNSRAIEEGSESGKEEKIALEIPAGNNWNDFKASLNALQERLVESPNPEINKLRIAKATVCSLTCPERYETGHGEISVTIGDKFTALITDGTTV